jgi:hypothetical protein
VRCTHQRIARRAERISAQATPDELTDASGYRLLGTVRAIAPVEGDEGAGQGRKV